MFVSALPGQRVQPAHHTQFNRYPRLFSWARTYCRTAQLDAPRVLSYGCSTGEEPATLARDYFPGSRIVAVDIVEAVVEEARRSFAAAYPAIHFDLSLPATIAAHGPYDVIFAMSVLCRSDARSADHLARLFPFDSFERHLQMLDSVLAPGGLLVLYNASHVFTDSAIAHGYEEVRPRWEDVKSFVPAWHRDGRPAGMRARGAVAFAKRTTGTCELVRELAARHPMLTLPVGDGAAVGR